jgi:hypothetical protein
LLLRSKPLSRKARLARGSRPRRVRRSPLGRLRNKLDALFALYVKDRDGAVCITCGSRPEGQNWHAGHFFRRGIMSLRWDPKNVHSQCGIPCNKFRRGALAEYATAIVERYGPEELARLASRAKTIRKWTRPELERLIAALEQGGAEYEMAYAEMERSA